MVRPHATLGPASARDALLPRQCLPALTQILTSKYDLTQMTELSCIGLQIFNLHLQLSFQAEHLFLSGSGVL